jgi:hypothetical protein
MPKLCPHPPLDTARPPVHATRHCFTALPRLPGTRLRFNHGLCRGEGIDPGRGSLTGNHRMEPPLASADGDPAATAGEVLQCPRSPPVATARRWSQAIHAAAPCFSLSMAAGNGRHRERINGEAAIGVLIPPFSPRN